MQFFAILSDSLRVFASFTYCEYTRASPNTLFPIIADYRRDSLSFISFYVRLLSISSRTPLYVTFQTSAPFLFSYSSLMIQREAFLFTFSYHFILFSRSFSEIFGHSRRLLKHFLFSNPSLFSIKTPCNSTDIE